MSQTTGLDAATGFRKQDCAASLLFRTQDNKEETFEVVKQPDSNDVFRDLKFTKPVEY